MSGEKPRMVKLAEQVRANPALLEALTIFADHWGIDSYDPPEGTVTAVRQIIMITCAEAQRSPLVNQKETP